MQPRSSQHGKVPACILSLFSFRPRSSLIDFILPGTPANAAVVAPAVVVPVVVVAGLAAGIAVWVIQEKKSSASLLKPGAPAAPASQVLINIDPEPADGDDLPTSTYMRVDGARTSSRSMTTPYSR